MITDNSCNRQVGELCLELIDIEPAIPQISLSLVCQSTPSIFELGQQPTVAPVKLASRLCPDEAAALIINVLSPSENAMSRRCAD